MFCWTLAYHQDVCLLASVATEALEVGVLALVDIKIFWSLILRLESQLSADCGWAAFY